MCSKGYGSRLCVCVCVCVTQHLTSRISDRAIKQRTYSVAYDRQNIDFSEMTAFKSYGVKQVKEPIC